MLKATKHGSTNYSHFSRRCARRRCRAGTTRVRQCWEDAQAPGIHAEAQERESELLTRRRLGWEEGELLLGRCCTPCDLGLVGGHLCRRQRRSRPGREILALQREKHSG